MQTSIRWWSFQKWTCVVTSTHSYPLQYFIIIIFLNALFFTCEWTYSKADNDTPFDLVHYFFLSFFFLEKKKAREKQNIYKNLVKPWNQNCTVKFTLQMNEDLYKKISLHGYIYTNTDITLMCEMMLGLPLSVTIYQLSFSVWIVHLIMYYLMAQPSLTPSPILLNNLNNSPYKSYWRELFFKQVFPKKQPIFSEIQMYIRCVCLDVWHLCGVNAHSHQERQLQRGK